MRAACMALSIWCPLANLRAKIDKRYLEQADPFELLSLSMAWEVSKTIWIDYARRRQ